MNREFDSIYTKWARLVEEDMGGAPPGMGGGGGDGGSQQSDTACFVDNNGLELLFSFIQLYNRAKEAGELEDRLTALMIKDRALLRDMMPIRAEKRLKKIFRVAGISQTDIDMAKKANKEAFRKAKEQSPDVEIRRVSDDDKKMMLDAIGMMADRLRENEVHDFNSERGPVSEVGAIGKDNLDYSHIWTVYNRIMASLSGEYRSGV